MARKGKSIYALDNSMAWAQNDELGVAGTALRAAGALGFTRSDIADIIATMVPRHFYKLITFDTDSKVWQEVYHVPSDEGLLYVEAPSGIVTDFMLFSFEELADG